MKKLICLIMGHNWKGLNDSHHGIITKERYVVYTNAVCERCGKYNRFKEMVL